jgi:large subunit ribosomal protein L9
MKVLLIKDVYKVGHAGDVKRVADGYGRNYLLPQHLAVLATPGALKQSEKIREEANKQREVINKEMDAIAARIKDVTLSFAAKAGETGKMYGSITTQDIANALQEKTGVEIKRHQIDMQPLRVLGEHKIHIRLTMDLVPEIKAIVYREGEVNPTEEAAPAAKAQAPAPVEEPVAIEPAAPEAEMPETEAEKQVSTLVEEPVAVEPAAPEVETPEAEAAVSAQDESEAVPTEASSEAAEEAQQDKPEA